MIKRVLITGAGTGVGLACTEKFLKENWAIVAHYRHSAEKLKKISRTVKKERLSLIKADFQDWEETRDFLNRVKRLNLRALVNNAGIHDLSHQGKYRITEIINILTVNTIVPTLIAEAVLDRMKHQNGGSIINISSIGVKYGSNRENIFYSISKSGLEAATRTLAREGAPYNILVNAIRPGVTATSFHNKLDKDLNRRKEMIPLKRLAKPEEIADFVYFLCAENTFITNETLAIAGGE